MAKKILDFYVGGTDDEGRWQGEDRYPPANPRLITAIVRRLIEHDVRHDDYRRVNILLCPKRTPSPHLAQSTIQKNWIDVYHSVPLDDFSSLTSTSQEREIANLIFQSALELFADDEVTKTKLEMIRREFESYYESKVAIFRCREKETKSYRVDVTFSINWGSTKPLFVAFVDYSDLKAGSPTKRFTFPLRGSDNDIFELCGQIAVRNGSVLLQPRATNHQSLRRLRYEIPFVIPIEQMIPISD